MASDSISPNRPIVTRADAKAQGLKRYFTGRPCKHGHIAERAVVNSNCFDCHVELDRTIRKRTPNKLRERVRRWREKHPAKARAAKLLWNKRNPKKVREHIRQWNKNNPDKVRAHHHRRRARRRNAGGTFTAGDIAEIRKLQRNRCARCEQSLKRKKVHIDHITPLARGGTNDRRNLQLLCALCNDSKGARDPIDDMRRLGRLL